MYHPGLEASRSGELEGILAGVGAAITIFEGLSALWILMELTLLLLLLLRAWPHLLIQSTVWVGQSSVTS